MSVGGDRRELLAASRRVTDQIVDTGSETREPARVVGSAVAGCEVERVAVEAIEGTDRMIQRAGELCRHGGWSLIKVAKPDQDMRFDVPTVGPETIAKLAQHGAKMLVIEAGRTVVIDREPMLAAAADAGIVVLSCRSEDRTATHEIPT